MFLSLEIINNLLETEVNEIKLFEGIALKERYVDSWEKEREKRDEGRDGNYRNSGGAIFSSYAKKKTHTQNCFEVLSTI